MKTSFTHLCLCLALLTALSRQASAALLAYEGFNYASGTALTNASDGFAGDSFGWAGRWSGANTPYATNVAGSLLYTDLAGNTLPTDGGSLLVGSTLGPFNVNAQPSRTLSASLGAGTYWVSFLAQWAGQASSQSTSNLFYRKGDLAFRSGAAAIPTSGGTELLAVGRPNANQFPGTPIDTWTLWSGGDGGAQASGIASSVSLTNVTWVLMKFVLDGTAAVDAAYAWYNWTNTTVSPDLVGAAANATNLLVNLDGLNNIRIDANNANAAGTNTVLRMDEFRLGTDFSDITATVPEPSTIALVGLGVLAVLAGKRKKSSR